MIAWAFCGSFCTLSKAIDAARQMSQKRGKLLCIVSQKVSETDTRFGTASDFVHQIAQLSDHSVLKTIRETEPIGPILKPEALIIAPCTGNTLAKLAAGITDSSVTMAAKAHLRNGRPLILGICTNDALSANLRNIGEIMIRKNIYLVPLYQDDPIQKPNSLLCDFSKIEETLDAALLGKQLQPLFSSFKKEN